MATRSETGNLTTSGTFARLVSADRRTTTALTHLFEKSRVSEFHRKYVGFEARGTTMIGHSSRSQESARNSSGNTTEIDHSDDEGSASDVVPCFIFSIEPDYQPAERSRGWRFGSGDFARDAATGEVELLLPSAADPVMRHGRFSFDPGFGRFWLHARHGHVSVNGEQLQSRSKFLLVSHARITIETLNFVFEFRIQDEERFQQEKLKFLRSVFQDSPPPHKSTSITPSMLNIRIGSWILHSIVGATRNTVIHAASDVRSGAVRAVKRLHLGPLRQREGDEVALYRAITVDIQQHRYARFVMQQTEVLDRGQKGSQDREVYLLWKPLARTTFGDFGLLGQLQDVSLPVRLTLFVQCLLGLSALHQSGWVHRDLKPENLGIVEYHNNPFATILDLGQAVKVGPAGILPRPKTCGTIGYLAPEMENQKYAKTYGPQVDVWSMGAVAYYMFVAGKLSWSQRDNIFGADKPKGHPPLVNEFRDLRLRMALKPSSAIEVLIAWMLEENPAQRPSLSQVLDHDALRATRKEIESTLDALAATDAKRKRG